jgi:hypothetical protein
MAAAQSNQSLTARVWELEVSIKSVIASSLAGCGADHIDPDPASQTARCMIPKSGYQFSDKIMRHSKTE